MVRASHSIFPRVFLAAPVEVGAAHETLPAPGRCVWDAPERRARRILRVTTSWIARPSRRTRARRREGAFARALITRQDFFLRRFGCQDGRRFSFDRPTGRVGSNLHL